MSPDSPVQDGLMPESTGWYLAGPLVAFVLVGILAAMLRWTLGRESDARTGRGRGERLLDPLDRQLDDCEDYGLLTAAARTDDRDTAEDFRRLLDEAGIRATLAPALDGRYRVLVFPEELGRARRLVGDSPDLRD